MNNETQGSWIDKIPIEEIIEREDFVRLEIFKTLNPNGIPTQTNPSYWEITLESKELGKDGLFSFGSSKSPQRFFKFYKLKP